MKTATVELPAIVVSAIKEYETTGKLLWRIGEGLDHVKIELTYKLPDNQPIGIVEQAKNKPLNVESVREKAKRRSKPAPSAGEWPRQSLPAKKPPATPARPTRQQPQRCCKTPVKELPPPPTDPCPETLPPKVAAGRVGAQPTAKQDCQQPTTPTKSTTLISEEPSPLQTPLKANDPPLTIHDLPNLKPCCDDIPRGTRFSSCLGHNEETGKLNIIYQSFNVASVRTYEGKDYMILHSIDEGCNENIYARYDECGVVIIAPPILPGYGYLGDCKALYNHFKSIYHRKATPTNSQLCHYYDEFPGLSVFEFETSD